jgi:hypothetical protein
VSLPLALLNNAFHVQFISNGLGAPNTIIVFVKITNIIQ